MLSPQYLLPIAHELVVDLFAGGGGASCGIEQAIGRHVDIAVNHDPEAVSLHEANHPQTRHYVSDVFEVDPLAVCGEQPVGLLWASPDCKHFSKAKGGKPVSKRIRGLAWVVIRWAKCVRPRVICLENVEEFQTWGPLADDGRPCPQRKGSTFRRWVAQLQGLGYAVEWRELRACDYGAPTIRKRLFLVARCDGQPIVWPTPTHGPKGSKLRPYRTAAECIDWSLPCPSIFERERPLAEATMRRIAHGIKRYVMEAAQPYILPIGHTGHGGQKHGLVAAFLAKHFGGEPQAGKTAAALHDPAPTVLATGGPQALVAAQLVDAAHADVSPTGVKRWGKGHRDICQPLNTVTASGNAALVTSHLAKLRGTSSSAATSEPLHTISAQGQHHAEVRALLLKYYGTDQDPQLGEPLHTVTTKDRFGLVTVAGQDYVIADIGMRMLQPRELYRAQGFPEAYIIGRGADGRQLSKAAQVRMCGNSVCPPLARAIVAANYSERAALREAA